MSKPMFSNSVITSTPLGPETDAVEASEHESEVIYYTVRGKRRRKREGEDLFRKLCVWYGTIPAPEAQAELPQVQAEQARALHELDLVPSTTADEMDWSEPAEETLPLVGLPLAEAEALA